MTREEKCLIAIEKGFTYDPISGQVFGVRGKVITSKIDGYVCIALYLNKKQFALRAHQFAWYWVNKEIVDCIDHINGEKDDNRICNLRTVTHQENQWNRTKAKGYYWSKKANKWRAEIGVDGKKICLGSFDTEDEARLAYLQAKEKYHIIQE